jgi:hypothetical protein
MVLLPPSSYVTTITFKLLIIDLVLPDLRNMPHRQLHYLSWTIIAGMTRMTGGSQIASIQWTLSHGTFKNSALYTTPSPQRGPFVG